MICIPWFSTFNVADIFITFGAIILNAVMSLGEPKEEKATGEPIELDRKA